MDFLQEISKSKAKNRGLDRFPGVFNPMDSDFLQERQNFDFSDRPMGMLEFFENLIF